MTIAPKTARHEALKLAGACQRAADAARAIDWDASAKALDRIAAEARGLAERIGEEIKLAAIAAEAKAAAAERSRRGKAAAAARRARALAAEYGFEIEEPNHSGLESTGVWAPAFLADTPDDPYQGDHYVGGWVEALERAEVYAQLVRERRAAGLPETSELPEHQTD